MTITDRDSLIAALAAGVTVPMSKTSSTTVAGRPWTLFRNSGNPVGGSTPTSTGAALDRTTAGALTIPAPSNVTYLVGWSVVDTALNSFLLYDRLVETGALSGTTTTAQTVSSATLPTRNTTGAGAELWLEIYGSLGATPSGTVTASYTNSANTSGRTATLVGGIPASISAGSTLRFTLQSGDVGVKSVQSVTSTTSTGTAGSFGVTIRQPIAFGPATTSAQSTSLAGFAAGYVELGMPIVPDAACLEVIVIPSSTSSGVIYQLLRIAQA